VIRYFFSVLNFHQLSPASFCWRTIHPAKAILSVGL